MLIDEKNDISLSSSFVKRQTHTHTSLVHTLTDMIFFFFTHSHVLQNSTEWSFTLAARRAHTLTHTQQQQRQRHKWKENLFFLFPAPCRVLLCVSSSIRDCSMRFLQEIENVLGKRCCLWWWPNALVFYRAYAREEVSFFRNLLHKQILTLYSSNVSSLLHTLNCFYKHLHLVFALYIVHVDGVYKWGVY